MVRFAVAYLVLTYWRYTCLNLLFLMNLLKLLDVDVNDILSPNARLISIGVKIHFPTIPQQDAIKLVKQMFCKKSYCYGENYLITYSVIKSKVFNFYGRNLPE